mgnify:CR=1 FL=1
MGYIVGIDIGGSTTKIVGLLGGEIVSPIGVKAGDPITSAYGAFGRFLSENNLGIADIDKVMFTGVGSSFIKESLFGIPTEKVDEFLAIGQGGSLLAGTQRAIIVSMGTGTALVSVDGDKIVHLGGSGVGGGTLMGLCDKMIGVRSFEHIVSMAKQGDLANVDLTIGDITEGSLSGMGSEITASNFGKLSDVASSGDLAVGVANMVFQTIGMFAVFAGKAEQVRDIVLTGKLSTIEPMRKVFHQLEQLHGVRFIIPENSDYATAIGAALSAQES